MDYAQRWAEPGSVGPQAVEDTLRWCVSQATSWPALPDKEHLPGTWFNTRSGKPNVWITAWLGICLSRQGGELNKAKGAALLAAAVASQSTDGSFDSPHQAYASDTALAAEALGRAAGILRDEPIRRD